jgi:hypothetical protein
MAASDVRFSVDTGNTFRLQIKLSNADGTAMDLTGAVLRGQLRKEVDDVAPVASFAVTYDSPRTTGIAWVALDRVQTAALDPGPYNFDVKLDTVAAETKTVLRGVLQVRESITR